MKILSAVLLCLFLTLGALAQTESELNDNADANVEAITLFRDDDGEAGEETVVFLPTDVPIHCSVALTSVKAAAVKMTLVAVKANGLRSETKIVTVGYQTNGNQNTVNFTAKPGKLWAAGKYRVDIFIDGKLNKSKEFDVQKSAPKVESEKQTPPKSAAQPKPAAPKRKN